jgi:hypothetical protein
LFGMLRLAVACAAKIVIPNSLQLKSSRIMGYGRHLIAVMVATA